MYLIFTVVTQTNSGTSTGPMFHQQQTIEVLFSKSSLSYADRLLLKQHRRQKIEAIDINSTDRTPGSVFWQFYLSYKNGICFLQEFK